MTACERIGSITGVKNVFRIMKKEQLAQSSADDESLKPNEIMYGAAISCCRKVGQPDQSLFLLNRMVKDGLLPNVATFNTVLISHTEVSSSQVEKLIEIYKLMISTDTKPNKQTYGLIIRSLAFHKHPAAAEKFLKKMHSAGFVPDVDLYTATVTSYERTGQPLRALQLMESMREYGYDFYDIKVLNDALKKAIKLVNKMGEGFSRSKNRVDKEKDDLT